MSQGGYRPVPPSPAAASNDNPLGLIALVCGLLSVLLGCPLSIAAIVVGCLGIRKEPKGLAMTGLILGAATLTLNVLVGCLVLSIYGTAFGVMAANQNAAGADSAWEHPQTEMTLTEASEILENHWLYAGSQDFPENAEGQALIAHLRDEWGKPIVYRQTELGESYNVISSGPDGVLDTRDDLNPYAD